MYQATICKLTNVRKHPNADRLNLATVFGNQVVVGQHDQEGDVGIFFPTDGQLSKEFAEANDLIRRKNPVTGQMEGGMFDENRRVRAQKFRGEKSDGFWCPIVLLKFTGVNLREISIEIGKQFDTINGIQICNKYETEATRLARKQQLKKPARNLLMFPKHFETLQFRNEWEKIPLGSNIIVTEKLHGTSHRVGHVLIKDTSLKSKILGWFGIKSTKWGYVHGTRNVVLDNSFNDFYHKSDFRQIVAQKLNGNLHKGEVVYLEIVGWSDTNTPIVPPHNTKKLKMPEVTEKYGEKMLYTYGCQPGECKIYVYRISQVNEDGIPTELGWNQVVRRCRELGVEQVPFVANFTNEVPGKNREFIEKASEGVSLLGDHIREGVCVRVENFDGTSILKQKSFMFREMEANSKDDDIIDIEEAS